MCSVLYQLRDTSRKLCVYLSLADVDVVLVKGTTNFGTHDGNGVS